MILTRECCTCQCVNSTLTVRGGVCMVAWVHGCVFGLPTYQQVLRLELVFNALLQTPCISHCVPANAKFSGVIPPGSSVFVHTFLTVDRSTGAPDAVPLLLAQQGGNDLYVLLSRPCALSALAICSQSRACMPVCYTYDLPHACLYTRRYDAEEQKAAAATQAKREERYKEQKRDERRASAATAAGSSSRSSIRSSTTAIGHGSEQPLAPAGVLEGPGDHSSRYAAGAAGASVAMPAWVRPGAGNHEVEVEEAQLRELLAAAVKVLDAKAAARHATSIARGSEQGGAGAKLVSRAGAPPEVDVVDNGTSMNGGSSRPPSLSSTSSSPARVAQVDVELVKVNRSPDR